MARAGSFSFTLSARLDEVVLRLVVFAGAETDPADPLAVGSSAARASISSGFDVAVLAAQRGRVVENLDDFKVRFLGLGEVVEALLNESQVEGDLRAQIEVFLQSLTGEGVVESVGGILGAVVNAQLAGVRGARFHVIAGVEVQHLTLAGGKGVVEAVFQPQVRGHQAPCRGRGPRGRGGRRPRSARTAARRAIVVFVEDAEAVEFGGASRRLSSSRVSGTSGGERLGPVAYGTLGAHRGAQ